MSFFEQHAALTKKYVKNCAECKKEFKTVYYRQIRCSEECKKAYQLRYHTEKSANKKDKQNGIKNSRSRATKELRNQEALVEANTNWLTRKF